MRFDSDRAMEIIRSLDDPRFAGPDGESHLADFVSERFGEMGWPVERREVVGSGFPRWAVSWPSWLGFGIVLTAGIMIIWTFGNRWPTLVLGWPLLVLATLWLYLALGLGLRFGWRLPPRRTAPLVLVRGGHEGSPACRVVFQTPLGCVSASPRESSAWLSPIVGVILYFLLMYGASVLSSARLNEQPVPRSVSYSRMLTAGLLAVFWVYLLARSAWEIRSRRRAHPPEPADRTGIAVLLEMARTWSSPRHRRVEIVFAATGGQALDFAGARAMLRSMQAELRRMPTLFVIWFAPGIGRELIVGSRHCRALAGSAAKSLWIPHRLAAPGFHHLDLWPPDRSDNDTVVLVGKQYLDTMRRKAPIDPEALHRAAQLATEIALRWAKRHQPPAAPPASAT